MTSVSGPALDPAPLFDLVTGFPPDDAIDVMLPMPVSLAVYMTMLEATGHASELATLQKIHIDQARTSVRGIRARVADLTGPWATASPRVRITHIIEHRVPRVSGLRPHIHAFLGATVRSPEDGRVTPVDVEALTALVDSQLFPDYRRGLVTATTTHVGLAWVETTEASPELAGPQWLTERTAQLQGDGLTCPGPWPRGQIVAGRSDPHQA